MRKALILVSLLGFSFVVSFLIVPVHAQGPLIGEIRYYSGNSVPSGWFLADGACISTTQYAELYSVIGNYYDDGVTCSSGYVQLPSLIGKFPYGTNSVVGVEGGESQHTLTVAEMPSHTHIQNAHHHSARVMQSTGSTYNTLLYGSYSTGTYLDNGFTQNTVPTNQYTGGGQAHNNIPPYVTLKPIIAYTTTNITPTPTPTATVTPTPTITPTISSTPVISVYTYTLDSGTVLTVPAQITTGQIIVSSIGLGLLAVFILTFTFRLIHRQ